MCEVQYAPYIIFVIYFDLPMCGENCIYMFCLCMCALLEFIKVFCIALHISMSLFLNQDNTLHISLLPSVFDSVFLEEPLEHKPWANMCIVSFSLYVLLLDRGQYRSTLAKTSLCSCIDCLYLLNWILILVRGKKIDFPLFTSFCVWNKSTIDKGQNWLNNLDTCLSLGNQFVKKKRKKKIVWHTIFKCRAIAPCLWTTFFEKANRALVLYSEKMHS